MSDEKSESNAISPERFLASNFSALLRALETPTKILAGSQTTWHPTIHVVQAEKSAEIDRQLQRIQPYLNWLSEEDETGIDEEGLNCSIAFLRAFANSPAPVPMLAIGNDGKPSAYLNCGGIALEAMFDQNCVQYLLTDIAASRHEYFEEDCERVGIPPNLMLLIYQHFARNAGKQQQTSREHV